MRTRSTSAIAGAAFANETRRNSVTHKKTIFINKCAARHLNRTSNDPLRLLKISYIFEWLILVLKIRAVVMGRRFVFLHKTLFHTEVIQQRNSLEPFALRDAAR